MPFFVNVPNVPGVPAVAFAAGAALETASFLTGDLINLGFGFVSQWGLFQDGLPVIIADTVIAFDQKSEWSISDYPVEQGGFETYDKVDLPFDVRLRFAAGGTLANRTLLLDSIVSVAGTTEIFDAITPEAIFESVTITHYSQVRTPQRGLGLMVVDVWCLQIREEVTDNSQSTTAAPDGASQTNDGAVQTQPASSAQSSAVSSGFQPYQNSPNNQ